MLTSAAIAVPGSLTFVAVDFERETLAQALDAAGFDRTQRSFFSWLGVVPYLTEHAVFSTLAGIAGLPGGAEVVFDYVNPAASITPAGRAAHQALAERVASVGESLQSFFDTERLCADLRGIGFGAVDDIDPARLTARFFPEAERSAPARGGHILHASTV